MLHNIGFWDYCSFFSFSPPLPPLFLFLLLMATRKSFFMLVFDFSGSGDLFEYMIAARILIELVVKAT